MKARHLTLILLASLALSVCLVKPPSASVKTCGAERWPVKVGSDPQVKYLFKDNKISSGELRSAKTKTIAELMDEEYPFDDITAFPPQSSYTRRVSTPERTIYKVEATLTNYKRESGAKGDSDYHLVLSDEDGNTMVAEIPNPPCLSQTPEPLQSMIRQARADFDAKFTVMGRFKSTNTKVRVTGPGFFDREHGGRGSAPNGIEIHPIIKIEFLD